MNPSGPAAPTPTKKLPLTPKTILVIAAIALLVIVIFIAKKATNNPTSKNTGSNASASQTVTIKELGVKLTLPDSLAGMKYSVDTIPSKETLPPLINLSLTRYTDLANICTGGSSSMKYTFATLIKQNGKAPAGTTDVIKQFNTFYVKNLGASVPKTTKCKDASTQIALSALTKDLNQSLQKTFDSAQQIQ